MNTEKMMMKKDWVETRLETACEIHDNLRTPVNAKERSVRIKGKSKSELYPYYGATGQVGFIDDYLTDGEYVLVGEDGAPFYDFAKNTAYMISGKAWVNNHAHILCSHFSNKFLLHYLNQFDFHGYISGTTRLKLTQKSLRKIPTKIAPLPEQRAIVAKIERLFGELDNGIAHLKAAREKLETYRQSVLKTAFDGKLLSSEQLKACRRETDYQPAGDLLKKINPKAVSSESKTRADWVDVNYKEVVDKVSISNRKIKQKKYLPQGKYPVIDQGLSLIGGYTDNQEKLVKCELPVIVFGDHTKVVKFISFQFVSGADGTKILQPKKFISPKYIAYITRVLVSKIEDKGYARHYQHIEKQYFPLPPLPEQRAIVSAIESRFAACDKLSRYIDEALERSQAMRQSILKKAFDGELLSEAELRECRKQPDWEPAEKLLRRIRESKPPEPVNRKK